jgi:hypothetical protein
MAIIDFGEESVALVKSKFHDLFAVHPIMRGQ